MGAALSHRHSPSDGPSIPGGPVPPSFSPLPRRQSRGSASPGPRRTTRRCSGSTIRSSPPSNAPSGLSGFRNTTPPLVPHRFHNALYFHVYPPLGRVMFSHVMLCHRRVCRVIACMVCYVNFCICHFFMSFFVCDGILTHYYSYCTSFF